MTEDRKIEPSGNERERESGLAPSPDQIWNAFSEPQQAASMALAVSHWGSGVGHDYITAMDIDDETLTSLTTQGVIETKPTWKFFQDLADELRDKATEIKTRMHENLLARLEEDDRKTLQDFDRFSSVAEKKDEAPRYRIADHKLHEYIASLGEE